MKWTNSRDLASYQELAEFEWDHDMKFSAEHREFLRTETNGGHLELEVVVPTVGCAGGAAELDGVYGVNHPKDYLDLADAISFFGEHIPKFVPFGYDACGGQVFVEMMASSTRLVYVPYEELDVRPLAPYHVADSIAEMLETGRALAIEFESEDLPS
jgi:hypothetical protein